MSTSKAIYSSYTGISPVAAEEICFEASINSDKPANCLEENESLHLFNIFSNIMDNIKNNIFTPNIVYIGDEPKEFSSIPLEMFDKCTKYDSVSTLLRDFYSKKDAVTRIRQKSSDLRKIVSTALERSVKKADIQEKQLKDTEKRDKYRVYGELINTYGYNIPEGSKEFKALNYYTNEEITIPLDPTLTPRENSVKYFNKYNKLKRTFEAESVQIKETRAEIAHLESVASSLDIAVSEDDLAQVKEELIESGYIHRHQTPSKKIKIVSKPLQFHVIPDGFDIYVGKIISRR